MSLSLPHGRQLAGLLCCCLLSLAWVGGDRIASAQAPAGKQAKLPPDHAARMQQSARLFKETVGPLLTKHCLQCHGGKWTKGDFSLATRELLLDSGMVAETSKDSHLLVLLRHEEEPAMPQNAPKLGDKELAAIARWIDLGAAYDRPLAKPTSAAKGPLQVTAADREHWSFRPLKPVPTPTTSSDSSDASDWARTPVDRFVLAQLQARELKPNAIAERRVLLRRACYDLTGLPPTPEQTERFLSDTSDDAYERLVDELLESPHYGERWARHWLDVARFAESHGYEQDYDRPHAYHYRDFLIQALNRDLPYDKFVQYQLAGDELEPQDPLAMMATGFLGAGVFPTQLTEAEFESARYDELDDMTTTTGVAFLGLSVGCARCHDHKYDPIPTRDYYRLAATFTSTIRSEIDVELDPEANRAAREQHQQQLKSAEEKIKQRRETASGDSFLAWLRTDTATSPSDWTPLAAKASSTGGKWGVQADGTLRADYPAPDKETVTIVAPVTGKLAAIRLEALTDPEFPQRGPGRAANGNFALGEIRLQLRAPQQQPQSLPLVAARATHQQNDGALSVAASIDQDPISGWAVDSGGIGKDQAAVFDLQNAVEAPEGAELEVTLRFEHPNTKHAMGRLRLSTGGAAGLAPSVGNPGPPAAVLAARKLLRELLANNSPAELSQREAKHWNAALEWHLAQDAPLRQLQAQLADLQAKGPALQLAKVQVTSEGVPHMKHHADGRGYPHFYPQTHFLERGDVHQKGEAVEAGFLEVLCDAESARHQTAPPAGATKSYRRAALARWITDTEHGAGQLAARVIVNRLWHHHFGVGIVATPNDFGFQGSPPSHPELLDYLARRLVDDGWRLKSLHKLIMTSAVYMQSSERDAERTAIDPDNRWLWRRSRRRLEAEAIRDGMLAVSGKLDATMLGPGTLD
ncbi:MAG: DUF1549 domain-containing protein, partial [Planctomycetales bacterium]|nr:DUF1549 domain-containing protein [Planctomycetales bacterium]